MKPDEFIAAISDAAQKSMQLTGVPASFTIAEGALESGWGAHAPGNNLFGVKADPGWKGAITTQRTREVIHGQTVIITANFRAYPDWQGCMDDHAMFFHTNKRYRSCFTDPELTGEQFAQAVAAAGYATDPDYAAKLVSIIRSHSLQRFDEARL